MGTPLNVCCMYLSLLFFMSFSDLLFSLSLCTVLHLILPVRPSGEHLESTLSPSLITRSNFALPKIGDVVTISFASFSAHGRLTTRFITRVRYDVTWTDVIENTSRIKLLNGNPSHFSPAQYYKLNIDSDSINIIHIDLI